MEISNTKAYATVQNTDSVLKKPEVAGEAVPAVSTADKVTLSSEALAMASSDSVSAATEPPGWPPIDEDVVIDPSAAVATEPPGWPPIDPPKENEKG